MAANLDGTSTPWGATNNMGGPTTSEFAPDLDEIIEDLNQIESPIDLLTAIRQNDWDGLIKLYSEPQLDDVVRSQDRKSVV